MTTPEDAAPGKPHSKRRLTLLRVLSITLVIALSVYIFTIRDQVGQLAGYGYLGIFLVAFMAYATVLLPAPGALVVFTMGAVFPPYGVALAAGAGAALGELSGYLFGFSGQIAIERVDFYNRLTRWMSRNGPITILLLSAIPNPFFDIAGVAAGALKMRVPTFLIWVWIGETIKMFFFAYSGSNLINQF